MCDSEIYDTPPSSPVELVEDIQYEGEIDDFEKLWTAVNVAYEEETGIEQICNAFRNSLQIDK